MTKKLYNKSENSYHYAVRDHCRQIWNIETNKTTQQAATYQSVEYTVKQTFVF